MKRLISSFHYAWQGLRTVFVNEANFRIHILATCLVLVLGYAMKISVFEWLAVFLSIGLVISMECINSALEYLADFISPDKHAQIKKVKDAAAGAVLVSALVAATVGFLIFIPKIWIFFKIVLNG